MSSNRFVKQTLSLCSKFLDWWSTCYHQKKWLSKYTRKCKVKCFPTNNNIIYFNTKIQLYVTSLATCSCLRCLLFQLNDIIRWTVQIPIFILNSSTNQYSKLTCTRVRTTFNLTKLINKDSFIHSFIRPLLLGYEVPTFLSSTQVI